MNKFIDLLPINNFDKQLIMIAILSNSFSFGAAIFVPGGYLVCTFNNGAMIDLIVLLLKCDLIRNSNLLASSSVSLLYSSLIIITMAYYLQHNIKTIHKDLLQ